MIAIRALHRVARDSLQNLTTLFELGGCISSPQSFGIPLVVHRGAGQVLLEERLDGSRFMVRIGTPGAVGDERLRLQSAVARSLRGSGVPPRTSKVHRVLLGGGERGISYLLEEYLEATNYEYLSAERRQLVAEALARVHRVNVVPQALAPLLNPPSTLRSETRDWLDRTAPRAIAPSIAKLIEERLSHGPGELPHEWLPLAVCHSDLSPDNLRVAATCRLIDWENARLTRPEWDVAHYLAASSTWWCSQPFEFSPDYRAAFLAEYADAYGCDVNELAAKVAYLIPLVHLRCIAWANGFAGDASRLEGRFKEETERRLARYVSIEPVTHLLRTDVAWISGQ